MNMQYTPEIDPELAKTLDLNGSVAARRRGRRRVVLALVVLLAVVGVGLLMSGAWDGGTTVGYETEPVRRGSLTQTVTATGSVEPTNQVDVSSELSGIVRKVLVDYNDSVKEGEVLAVLDTDKLTAEVRSAKASLAVKEAQVIDAEATVAETKQALARSRTLSERKITSTATLEEADAKYKRAEAALAVSKAEVDVAKAALETAETNLSKASILSPISGVVISRDIDPGQTVAASLEAPVLFTIAEDLSSMQLEVDIDEADVGVVEDGQASTFTVEAFRDRTFPGEVEEIRLAPETVNDVVTYTGVIRVQNPDLVLRPGMTATADIVVSHDENALLIPNKALRFRPPATEAAAGANGDDRGFLDFLMPRPPRQAKIEAVAEPTGDERTVYVLKNGEPEAVTVHIGASDGTLTAVTGPLEEGDPLVIAQRAAGR
ncbi:efflux RND transporter periplasmic adaptor subunit [Acuticoccus mangrovi]|uniref:Efflux RND transporter periplasmic adaptor subunit n=1 Tax=Acuticoccus mangrovi TaxID=2796142 RepID=A0A934IVD5_9HYPH|nr:efflux RND transporter periplasmic adaptor subunit [Acuticoccus mangrovi]MBJ3778725.1 efflux RND transporter periplasmic adaptor subunit [Acuticoccus mangrovi]